MPTPAFLRPEIMVPLLANNRQGMGFRENKDKRSIGVMMRGTLSFAAADAGDKLWVYDAPVPSEFRSEEYIADSRVRSDRYIEDQYELEIFVHDGNFPIVKEIGEETASIAKARKMKLEDLHINIGNNSCCLCVPPKARAFMKNPDAPKLFIPEMVIPFFYRLSCVKKKMALPQWGEHKHGLQGLLEFYQQSCDELSHGDDFHAFLCDLKTCGLEGLLEFYQRSGKQLPKDKFDVFLPMVKELACANRNTHLHDILIGQKMASKKVKPWIRMVLREIALRCKS